MACGIVWHLSRHGKSCAGVSWVSVALRQLQPDSNNSQDDIFSKLGMAQQMFVKFLGVRHLYIIFGISLDHTQLTSAAIAPVTATLCFSQEPSALRWFAALGSHHHLHLAA